jgi:hypothetical protein
MRFLPEYDKTAALRMANRHGKELNMRTMKTRKKQPLTEAVTEGR